MVVVAVVVIPPLTDARCGEPSDKDDVVFDKSLLVELEVDDKAKAIPLELLGAIFAIGKPTDRITYGPRSGERRRELREGADVFAWYFRSSLPVVECKPESNLLLESDVTDKNRPVESCRSGFGKGQTLDVDVGVGVRWVGEWSRSIDIDDRVRTMNWKGWRSGGLRERVSWRFCLSLGLSFFTRRSGDICRLPGPLVDADRFETIVRLCEMHVLEKVWGSWSRLSTEVCDLRDMRRGGRRFERRFERLPVG
jgi:hypothetical protein